MTTKVTGAMLDEGAAAFNLDDGSITSAMLEAGAAADNLGAGSVTTAKIADHAVTPTKMDLTVEVPLTGIARLRGASDTGDSLTLVGGAANENNRMQIRGASHPTTPNTMTVDLAGAEALRFNSSGHLIEQPIPTGYGTGAGGTVTQATNKSTNVTLDKPVGRITMNNAALAASTTVGFALNCSFIAATDIILLTIVDASVSSGANYNVWATVGGGGALIKLRNISAGSLSEAVQINYAIIKGATS